MSAGATGERDLEDTGGGDGSGDTVLGTLPITFAIVGVQKGATSMIDLLLSYHRQVAAKRVPAQDGPSWYGSNKELHFFDDEALDWDHPDYRTYARLQTKPHHKIAGDSTPSYLFWPHALERMHAYDARMRLVASFRDPVERAFSQWCMGRSRPRPFPPFSECLERYDDASLLDRIPDSMGRWEPHRASMVVRGLYGAQLRRGLDIYPREQWLLLSFDDFIADYQAVLDRLTDHLGVHRYRRYPLLPHNPTPPVAAGAAPTAEELERLAHRYADDLAEFERLSGIDVSAWPTRRITDGSMDAAELAEKFSRKIVASA
ncbi:MAG: sulfotransferase [Nocardioides sp.]